MLEWVSLNKINFSQRIKKGVINLNLFQNDKLFLGALAGFLSDILMDIAEAVFHKFGLFTYTLDQFAGSMFIRDKSALLTFYGNILGFLAGAALCIILGVVFVYLIEFTGFRKVVFKGLLYGFILWFLIYGGAKTGLQISYLQDYNPYHTVLKIFTHLIFGVSLGIIVVLLKKSRCEKQTSQ